GERGCDDREFSLIAEHFRSFIHQCVSNTFRGRLIDEEIARVGLSIRIPGDDLDTFLLRLAKCCGEAFPIFYRDSDDINTPCDPSLNDFVLARGIWLSGTIPQQFYSQILGSLLRALAAGNEVCIALAFGHHCNGERLVRSAAFFRCDEHEREG